MYPLPIPKDDPACALVMLLRYEKYDPDEITTAIMVKFSMMCLDILFNENDNFVVSGLTVIFNLKGVHLKTILQCTPTLIQKATYGYENTYLPRVKGIYFINTPAIAEPVLNAAKKLISKKLASRLHFHSTDNLEEICKDIPKYILPNEYGGNAGSVVDLAAKWKETAEKNRERLLEEKNYYSDESKRAGPPNTPENLFGAEGSFKELTID